MANKKFELDKNVKKKMIGDIINFYAEEQDEEIGELKAEIILDFVTDKLSYYFYNEGLKDAQAHISNALEDLKAMER